MHCAVHVRQLEHRVESDLRGAAVLAAVSPRSAARAVCDDLGYDDGLVLTLPATDATSA